MVSLLLILGIFQIFFSVSIVEKRLCEISIRTPFLQNTSWRLFLKIDGTLLFRQLFINIKFPGAVLFENFDISNTLNRNH